MDPLFQRPDLTVGGLQLDMNHGPMAHERQRLQQGRDGLVSTGEPQFTKIGGAAIADLSRDASHPHQVVVVEDHCLAVCRQLHVQLDAIAGGASSLEGGQGILRRAVWAP